MAMNLTVLDQDPATGKFTPIKLSNVDVSASTACGFRAWLDYAVDDASRRRGIRAQRAVFRKAAA